MVILLPCRNARISPDAVTKLAGENYCGVVQEVYGLSTACLRYFNVYGPRQDPNSQYAAVIPRFIRSCIDGDSPVIYGDGEQTRDFTFVRDVVMANMLAGEGGVSGIFNVSTGESITINMLAGLIAELIGNKVEPIHEKERAGDIRHSLADISRAKTFGYNPEYDLKTGLVKTIEWFKNG
jgi:UDP-glucose 4-epimerase